MLWLILILIIASVGSIGAFIDNYAADVIFKKNKPEAFKFASSFGYALLMIIAAVFFGIEHPGFWLIGVFTLAGFLDALGNIPYFQALKYQETTSITIIRQISPIFALTLGVLFLNQTISVMQLVAFFFVLSAAAVVLFASTGRRKNKFEPKTISTMLIAIFIWVVSDVVFVAGFVNAVDHEVFSSSTTAIWTALFWFALGKGALPFVLGFALKSWRTRLKRVWRDSGRQFALWATISNVIRVSLDCIWRFVITIAPLALLNVVGNVTRLLFTFGFGLALSVIWPIFGREKITKKAIMAHLIAVVLAVIGVILLQTNMLEIDL
ncbi:EamA family transporter [Candidatus Saccharibacteria bacterium]|nr:EamA family transporter [Candidatus Saccharibacteria bacterium]